jgi:tetratricopeptide (TPR) repeat protein
MNETRYLYKKSGNSPFATGSRLAIVGNWEEAAGYWKEVINSSPNRRKLCGKAAYNLAVAAEMKGDLEEARNWISKSYGIYNNKQAPYYQNTINRRYNAMLQLNQQMQEQK